MLSEHAAHTTIPILQTSEIIRKLLLFLEKNFFDVMHTLHIIHSIRAVTIILVSLTALTSCTQRQWRHAQGAAWGTSYHITYFSNRVLDDSVVAVMRNVELSLSPFEPASNISLSTEAIQTLQIVTCNAYLHVPWKFGSVRTDASTRQ